GSPITAEDVAFTLEILLDKGAPSYRVLLRDVLGATVEDVRTVRFDFAEAAPKRDLPMLVGGLPVLSKAYYATRDFAESTLEPPLGSGPYRVEEAEPGRRITYIRRDDYWGWDLGVNRGRWNFERVRYEYFRDNTAAFEAFKGGGFRFHEEFFSKLWNTGYDFPAVREGAVKREAIPDERTAGTQGWWFNLRRPLFQDVRVRQAIALGFDFEWSNRTLFGELYERTDSFFEGGPMQAQGQPSPGEMAVLEPFADQLPEGLLDAEAYSPPVTDGSGRNRRNLRRAARLLDEAGWSVGEGGVRVKDGQELRFEVLGAGPGFERIVNPYMNNLERVGIKGVFRLVDPAQYQERMKDFDFDITGRRYAMRLTPGTELRGIFGSEAADTRGSANVMGLKDPVVDALIERIMAAESREELTDLVKALDRVVRALHIWVPNWTKGSHTIAYWDIFGRPPEKPSYARGVIDLWWIDPDKFARLQDRLRG
ncbi:MAG: extracellular solute-binding protein, partial [Pseudomonadota bacterium]